MSRRTVVPAAVILLVSVLLTAIPAQAHVKASAPLAEQGGYATITFTVPTESDTASTTGLTVQLPTDTPIPSVSVQPKAGWTFSAPKQKLAKPVSTDDGPVSQAVTQITWRATSGAIKPGEFDTFVISAGPLPKLSMITFKALQRYSDGTTVSWIQTPAPGSTAEPQYPAPTLALAAAGSAGGSATSAPASSAPASTAPAPSVPSGPSVGATKAEAAAGADGSDGGNGLALGALVVGAVGVLLGAAALGVQLRRRTTG